MHYTMEDARRLAKLSKLVPWERLRGRLEDGRAGLSDAEDPKSPPLDDVLIVFRAVLVGGMYGLSDGGVEEELSDRISLRKFVGIEGWDMPPSADSLWLHRTEWGLKGVLDEVVAEVDDLWRKAGYRSPGLMDLLGAAPVRVGWIVDAQARFLGADGPLHVPAADEADAAVEVDAGEAAAALARAVERMAERCHVMVYTRRATGGEGSDGDDLLPSVRPPAPLALDWEASELDASALAVRALREGRHVVCRGTGGVFERRLACETFLEALEKAMERDAEILVAGHAADGSLASVVDGLRPQERRVLVIRDAVFSTAAEIGKRDATSWAGRGRVVSLRDVRGPLDDLPQVSFGDLQMAEAYEHIDRLLDEGSHFVPLAQLDEAVPWALFRRRLEASRRSPPGARDRDEPVDRHDALVAFKSLLLGAVYDVPDATLALLLHDRLTFKRFVGLGVTDRPPTAALLGVHRNRWTGAGAMTELVADVEERWASLSLRFEGLRRLAPVPSSGDGDGDDQHPGPESGVEPAPSPRTPKPRTPPKKGAGKKKRMSRAQRRRLKRKGK